MIVIHNNLFYFVVHKWFKQRFDNWTSKNEFIDRFIQETQLKARFNDQILEWIPYNRLKDIKYLNKGGFGTIYEAIWLDGPIKRYNDVEKSLIRFSNKKVVIKSFNNSSNLNNGFLNEV